MSFINRRPAPTDRGPLLTFGEPKKQAVEYQRAVPQGPLGQSMPNRGPLTKAGQAGYGTPAGNGGYPTTRHNLNGQTAHGDRPQLHDEFAMPDLDQAWIDKIRTMADQALDGKVDPAQAATELIQELQKAEDMSTADAYKAVFEVAPEWYTAIRANGQARPDGDEFLMRRTNQDGNGDNGEKSFQRQAKEQRKAAKIARELMASGSSETARRYFAEDEGAYEAYRRMAYTAQSGARVLEQPAERVFHEQGATLGSKKLAKLARQIGRDPELQRAFRDGRLDAGTRAKSPKERRR